MKICVHICLHAGEISPLQQLSAGAWGGFPWKEPQAGHSATHRSKSCNMEIWIGLLLRKFTPFAPPSKMCYSSTYLHSIVCKIAFNVAWTVQTIKPWDIYENYDYQLSGWTVLLNSHCFTRDLRHTMWLNCCDLADFCGIKMQRYEVVVSLLAPQVLLE